MYWSRQYHLFHPNVLWQCDICIIDPKKICHAHSNALLQKKFATPTLTPITKKKFATPSLTPTKTEMYWSRQYLSIGPKKLFATPTLTPITLKSVLL